MKHMPLIMAHASATTLALEQQAAEEKATLALEGWFDAVKKPLAALKKMVVGANKTEVEKDLEAKIKGVATERKRLEAVLKQISKSDFKGQQIKLNVSGFNFVVKTIDDVHRGLASNISEMEKLFAKMKAAKTRDEIQAIHKEGMAALDTKPNQDPNATLWVDKGGVMKVLEGSVKIAQITEAMLRHLVMVEISHNVTELSKEGIDDTVTIDGETYSTEGIRDFLGNFIIAFVVVVLLVAVAVFINWTIFALAMVHPLLGVLGLIAWFATLFSLGHDPDEEEAGVATEGVALEGVVDTIKNPIAALKKAFPLNDEEAFAREVMLKRAVVAKERKGLTQAKTVVSQSKDAKDHVINLKKVVKSMNFSADTPEQVLAGMASNRKFLEKVIKDMEAAKTKAQAKFVMDQLQAEQSKRGQIKEEMTFSRAQALKAIDEGLALCDVTDRFLKAADEARKKNFTQEGFLDGVKAVGGAVAGAIGAVIMFIVTVLLAIISVAFNVIIGILLIIALLVNPWLVLAVGVLWLIGNALDNEGHEITDHRSGFAAG